MPRYWYCDPETLAQLSEEEIAFRTYATDAQIAARYPTTPAKRALRRRMDKWARALREVTNQGP